LNLLRLAFAATAIVAMTYQFADSADSAFRKANFVSFFTIQSNILAVVMLCLLVVVRRDERTALFDGVRGGVVLSIAATGIVFALLLSGLQEDLQTSLAFVNFVVHQLMPLVLFVDWLVDPPRNRLPWWVAGAWVAYPLAYAGYTLVRGAVVGWYPYPFLDVERVGYDGVLVRVAFLGIVWAGAAFALLWLERLRAAPPPAP
jgi:hypothetical protein